MSILKYFDKIRHWTETVGTGVYALTVIDTNPLVSALFSDGDQLQYCVHDSADFEVGIGTVGDSGTTIARTLVLRSSNSNNPVDWSAGYKEIYNTALASSQPIRLPRDPFEDDNPPFVGYTHINTLSGEKFICTRIALDFNFWVGNLGKSVGLVMGLDVVLPDGSIVGAEHDGYWLVVASAAHRQANTKWGLYATDTSLYDPDNLTEEDDPEDGEHNTDVLMSAAYVDIDDYQGSIGCPVAKFARTLGSNWFAPNKEELEAILLRHSEIDAADTSGGSYPFSTIGTTRIWSSTELGANNAYYCKTTSPAPYYEAKNGAGYAVPLKRYLQ